MRRIFILARPFAVALAVFIFMNLALAIQHPSLSANRVWLYLKIPEPLLSILAGVLGLALFAPHAWAGRSQARLLIGGITSGFLVLSAANIIGFCDAMRRGRVVAGFPVPFSAFIAAILATETARVIWWAPVTPRLPPALGRILSGVVVLLAFLSLILAHIITFGMTDYSPAVQGANAVVVLGARVHPDGRLSNALEDRMWTGVRLHSEGKARYLILSGGVDPLGVSEPQAMAAYARRHGVPENALILDEEGRTTFHSARSCGRIARERGFRHLLVVSQYFHNARVKLIFEREGTPCYTVPARYRRLVREGRFLLREAIAFPFYHLYYTEGPAGEGWKARAEGVEAE